ncbi:MAG: flagellar basal body P-ring formation chaperone FlgA [Aquificaceae bacterium]|nr:flagellar basal body P-ring formation chaperone FlgA [Aquificaceae bacterium]MDW8294391.1 flagellar basal body P-ring formation chaperone FlgA [Aquificaceae bacterium]
MWFLSLLIILELSFGSVERLVEEEVYRRFGELVKVQRVKLLGKKEVKSPERIELQMEYGKSRAVAYLYFGDKREQVLIDALWKVRVFVALEDIQKGSAIKPEMFRVEEVFMKTIPSDLRLNPADFENYTASTNITRGTVLRRSLLKEVQAVKVGEVVEAFYKSGALEVSFRAVAIDGGQVGKVIRLRKEDRVLRGRVLSKGKVEVLP